jgi:hypothetical protein
VHFQGLAYLTSGCQRGTPVMFGGSTARHGQVVLVCIVCGFRLEGCDGAINSACKQWWMSLPRNAPVEFTGGGFRGIHRPSLRVRYLPVKVTKKCSETRQRSQNSYHTIAWQPVHAMVQLGKPLWCGLCDARCAMCDVQCAMCDVDVCGVSVWCGVCVVCAVLCCANKGHRPSSPSLAAFEK